MNLKVRFTASRMLSLQAFLLIALCPALKAQSTLYSDTLKANNFSEAIKGTRAMLLTRYVGMATYNRGVLSDYYANGMANGLYLKTQSFKGFQLGAGASAIVNILSSNLSAKDPLTGLSNRYEIGLFDLDRPSARFILKLEELYLQYSNSKVLLRGGNFLLRSPYINPQDGRLRPNFVQGFWLAVKPNNKFKAESWFLTAMAPRSTSGWHRIEKTIGMYPQGFTSKGVKANYRGKQVSAGTAILNLNYKPIERFELQLWNQYVENIFNTAMLQAEYRHLIYDSLIALAGVQIHQQNRLNYGGNSDQNCAYYEGQSQSSAISFRLGLSRRKLNFSFNYLNIFSDGRFLMPREWGRDVFYTFMPREKQEGYARLQAYTFKASINSPSKQFRIFFGYGLYFLPEPTDLKRNKYASPSYQQSNFELTYYLSNRLRLNFLFVSKLSIGNSYQPKYVFNKTDMWHATLTLQYTISNFINAREFF